ncbi:HD domain-containing protein [Patescibacteria group bacterium]|nr:HD domain-containing protein [Patescibacteria group bacterium]
MITLAQVKKNPQILEFIKGTENVLAALSYTDHGFRHADLVADRARTIAKEIGLSGEEGELAAIAGFCHDMGNFLSRTYHNYFGALLFSQVFKDKFEPKELVTIMQAIANHDKKIEDVSFASPISAIVVLADKSDVHRSRVSARVMEEIKSDIHDRVNYATKLSRLKIDKNKKRITLTLRIDTNFVPIVEYFEIFTDRMVFCRKAAEYLGYDFGLIINKFRLL